MTTLDTSICWAVLAPLPVKELERVAAREWARDFPYSFDPPPWQAIPGAREYNALVSRSPGTEGSDRHFAEILSALSGSRTSYSLWFDSERGHVFEWRNGREVGAREGDPTPLAESLGFTVSAAPPPDDAPRSVAVVEGASTDEVTDVLRDVIDDGWIRVETAQGCVLVTATDGRLGTQAWDLADALAAATVYYVQQSPSAFSVLVLRGQDEIGAYRSPPPDDDTPVLADIKGSRTPAAILAALGVPPEAFGHD